MKKKKTEEVKGVICEFTTNQNGVKIKKCCASCETHEPLDSEGRHRLCTKHNKVVDKSDCCSCWRISSSINKIKLR